VQPDLETIFALRLSSQRKLMLIAMIHRAKDGYFRDGRASLVHDVQVSNTNVSHVVHSLARAGLIHEDPDNSPCGMIKVWRIDPKFIIGNQNGKSGMDGGRGRDAASVVDGGTISGGNRAADFPAEELGHQQKPPPVP
jgi:hypothetical protein